MDVKVIAERFAERAKTDPSLRSFTIADLIPPDPRTKRSNRFYVGDEFRAILITLLPGEEQEVHLHPETDHAWFVVSGSGVMTMEDGKTEQIRAGMFCVHPRNTVHGLRNNRDELLVYIALSTGK